MRPQIQEIISRINKLESERESLASLLRADATLLFPDAYERELVKPVAQPQLNCKVAAVDGGLLAQEFHGCDLVLSRAVGVLFEYNEGKLISHSYHPASSPEPELAALESLDNHEFQWHKSLFRLKKELECARECIEKFRPHFLLMDGSLVPQISDIPSDTSEVRALYNEVISDYISLYESATRSKCALVGVIKDSRGKHFMSLLSKVLTESAKETLARSTDTSFLHFLLNENERTFFFPYSTSKGHQVLRDFGEWGTRIHAFYLRPSGDDRPLRVEFLSANPIGEGESIPQTILALSKISKNYAYPAVLIEADMRAALEPIEMERAYRELFMHTGMKTSILKLRRDSRPFR
ncbi:MAG: DNA double-strand break repair nuclease NurA [Candidatus Micrarchaeota archaeon]